MKIGILGILSASGSALLLTACGGGNAGPVASAPSPAPVPASAPAPTPPASPQAVLPPDSVALESSTPFVTFAVAETDTFAGETNVCCSKTTASLVASEPGSVQQGLTFSYDAANGTYNITLPDGTSGQLVSRALGGSAGSVATSTTHRIEGDDTTIIFMHVPQGAHSPYTYSHFGSWEQRGASAPDGLRTHTYGHFVYGMETPAAGVPRTGSANYTAEIRANSPMDPWDVTGEVHLAFNFAEGTLTGWMHPVFNTNGWYPELDFDYGRYQFAETVYAVGSSRYSGIFTKDGTSLAGSFFEGSLTGPAGEETVGRFVAPFVRSGIPGNLSGIWIGKRD